MKILSAQQIYAADKATIKSQGINSIELMERAGTVCFDWIHKRLQGNPIKILVFCGVGNNGGDGLVISRHLIQHGYNVSCYVVNFSEKRTDEFLHNYNRLKDLGTWPITITSKNEFPEISNEYVVVDAIFGIGLKGSIKDFTSDLITHINKAKAYTLSIDIPSGMYADKTNSKDDFILEASHTLTFQQPKLAFLLPNNQKYIYTWQVIDIALDEEFLDSIESDYFIIQKEEVKSIYKMRDKFSHKVTFGHSLLIGGSYGKMGAISLASKAALKSGSGLVTAYVPKCGYEILQISIPEVMVEVDADKELYDFNFKSKPTVIGIGPGMGTSDKTLKGFSNFLEENTLPLVIDADALNLISVKKGLLKKIPENSILTPHPKELERLIGEWNDDYEKIKKTKALSVKYKIIIVLKGANTVIVDGNKCHFNSTGNPALATAGSGDVLTGIITGLLAQKYSALNAAKLGVYLHGKSADIGLEDHSVETFTASNILDYLGDAFKSLFEKEFIIEDDSSDKA